LVAERRHLPIETVKALADGRIMTGRAAKQADLVDELGGLYDAARKAVTLAKAKKAMEKGETTTTSSVATGPDPTLVYPKKPNPTLLEMLTGQTRSAIREGVEGGIRSIYSVDGSSVELR
jgi:ClpP class serine protease